MTLPASPPPARAKHAAAPSPQRALRRLFLTVFLRGRSARGLSKDSTPKSVGEKFTLMLAFYGLYGVFTLVLLGQPVFVLSACLHAMTFVLLGMFVASAAGEVLFNQDEADILLHRPVTARALLWAKISVLVRVSLWLAAAFNLVGFFTGVYASDGGWLFPVAHTISTAGEALFCASFVLLVYQLCLRWFGREWLDGLMTTAQVLTAVGVVLVGQVLPRLAFPAGRVVTTGAQQWWMALLPPAWFAGFDDAMAGSGSGASWLLAAVGLMVTTVVLWLAFGKLAGDYESGLRTLSEALAPNPRQRARRRWMHLLVNRPPVRWWLRDPVTRASFLLTTAYLLRDRDAKLRVYPGFAPALVLPILFLMHSHDGGGLSDSTFGIAFAGSVLSQMPMLGLSLLQYSQHWQAADMFRAAPMSGPSPLGDGARRAVLMFSILPLLLLLVPVAWITRSDSARLLLVLPGLITVPVFALIPCFRSGGVPLSQPTEAAKSVGRGLIYLAVTGVSLIVAGLTTWSWSAGWFGWLLGVETIVAGVLHLGMRALLTRARWPSLEGSFETVATTSFSQQGNDPPRPPARRHTKDAGYPASLS